MIGFEDFVHRRRIVAESLLASQSTATWGKALRFPYPNGHKFRELVVLDAPDLGLLRASAGRIARSLEQRLSLWSFGYRTKPNGMAWTFDGDPSKRYRGFTQSAIRLLQRGDLNAMCSTDVASYYASIELDRLEAFLREADCDPWATTVLLSGFRRWASVDGTSGLPIGPEASTILGNGFLIPIDQMLVSRGFQHVRWMDDFKLMGPDEATCRRMEGPFDEILSTQGLTRSIEKTQYYSNALAAISSLKDGRLSSLGYRLNSDDDLATGALRTAFEREMAEEGVVSPSRFRFIVRALKNRADDFAAGTLANNSAIANIDPKLSGDYLGSVALTSGPILDAMFTQLLGAPADETDALDLLAGADQAPGRMGRRRRTCVRIHRRKRFATATDQMLGSPRIQSDVSVEARSHDGERGG